MSRGDLYEASEAAPDRVNALGLGLVVALHIVDNIGLHFLIRASAIPGQNRFMGHFTREKTSPQVTLSVSKWPFHMISYTQTHQKLSAQVFR